MAEETDKLLYVVEFDSKQAEDRAKALKSQISLCTTELEGLDKELQAGVITQAEYNKSAQSITKNLKLLTAEQKSNSAAIAANEKLQETQNGSIKRGQVAIQQLTEKYQNMAKAQREGAEGKEVIKRINELTEATDKANKPLTEGRKSMTDYIKSLNILGINVGDTAAQFKNGTTGIVTFAKGIFSARGALVALTAVPIVAALTAIIAFFKSTDEGADKLEQGLAFLTAGFDALLKGIAPAGKLLVDLFTHPLDTIKKLTKGTDEYNVSLTGIAKSAYQAAEAHRLYTQRMQDVEDNENALIAQREKVGLQVDQAILKVKDRSLSEQEKIRILREAGKAEAELAQQSIKNAKDAYVAKLAENITIQRSRKLTDDELKAQLEAEAKMIAARRESLNVQQTIRNRETAQIEEAETKRKALTEKRKAEAETAAQSLVYQAELAVIAAKRLGEDTLAIDEVVIRRQAALDELGAKTRNQRLLIQAKAENDIAQLRINRAIEVAARLDDIEQNSLKTLLAQVKEGSQAQLEINLALIRAEAEQQRDQARATIQNKTQLDAQLKRIDAETKQKLLGAEKDFIAKVYAAQQQRIEDQQKVADTLLNRFNQDQQKRITSDQDVAAKSLAVAKEGSQAESDARLAQIEADRKAAIQAATESGLQGVELQKRFDAINAQADRAASDERKRRRNEEIDNIQTTLTASAELLSNFLQAQAASQAKALDDQQKAQLDSAGLSAELREGINQKFDKKREEAEKKSAEQRRHIAEVETIINTAAGIAKAIPNPLLIALAAATGLAQLAVIESQQFAEGGVLSGPSHAGGGIKMFGKSGAYYGEAEGDEIVLTKGVYRDPRLRAEASRINVMAGGRPLDGFPLSSMPRMDYGGVLSTTGMTPGLSPADIQNIVISTMANMPPTIVQVQDIRAGVGRVAKVEDRASIKSKR